MQSKTIEKMDNNKQIWIITGERDSVWAEETKEYLKNIMPNKK